MFLLLFYRIETLKNYKRFVFEMSLKPLQIHNPKAFLYISNFICWNFLQFTLKIRLDLLVFFCTFPLIKSFELD